MDTRFWGPSGWKLLHLIVASPMEDRSKTVKWFCLLPFVLPCKYCRASLHEYYRSQPPTEALFANPETAGKWLYDIHNRVNEKLRNQGLLTKRNPSWISVRKIYSTMSKNLCDTSPLLGWDFMTSIAFMTRKERIHELNEWWSLIPSILPCSSWRQSWKKVWSPPPLHQGRLAVMSWMWKIEEGVCSSLQCPPPHDSLVAMKKELSVFESKCSGTRKTCRSSRSKTRKRQDREE